jgi:hypothetical protein
MQSSDAISRRHAAGLHDPDSDVSRNRSVRSNDGHLLWIALGSIVVSTAIALLGCKRSKTTLSEIAEKLERQVAARSDPDEGNYIGNFPRC